MTHSRRVAAADGVRSAGIAAPDADDGKGGAVQAEETRKVTQDDAEETAKEASGGGCALPGVVVRQA